MALRIGVDLDGVLADMDSVLARHVEQLFGPAPEPPAAVSTIGGDASLPEQPETPSIDPPVFHRRLTDRQHRLLWRRVKAIDGFWESLEETEAGVVSRLAALAAARRWDILFLTRRPATAGATAQVQSQRWLTAKGFQLPSVFVVTGSRGLIAASLALDVVVDDLPENCLDVTSDSRARAIAVIRETRPAPPASLESLGIRVVRSTDECLNALVEIDEALAPRPSAIERLKRRLGWTQAAQG